MTTDSIYHFTSE